MGDGVWNPRILDDVNCERSPIANGFAIVNRSIIDVLVEKAPSGLMALSKSVSPLKSAIVAIEMGSTVDQQWRLGSLSETLLYDVQEMNVTNFQYALFNGMFTLS